jgi:lipopolysaccharide/colanic/teichoic acid biosynthesis glycosyltransferase
MTSPPMDRKRLLDLAIALPAAALAAPAVAALAAAVKLTSPGPAFYVQERVGKDRRSFRLVKLRTMTRGADQAGPHVTAAGDARITPLGRLLRKTKLDELPQLWNVLTGDMSVVGPRPEAPRYVTDGRPEWDEVLSVRPGITDLASLTFRDEEALLAGVDDRERAYLEGVLPAKLRLAAEGVRQSSALYDLGIVVRTALAVFNHPAAAPRHDALEQAQAAIQASSAKVPR